MDVLRRLAGYARMLVRYMEPRLEEPLVPATTRVLRETLGAAVDQERQRFEAGPGYDGGKTDLGRHCDIMHIGSGLLKTKTKRIKQRVRRAADSRNRGNKPGDAVGEEQLKWPNMLKGLAENAFQNWQDDVFMWCAHVAYRDILEEYDVMVGSVPQPVQVAQVIAECGEFIMLS